MKQVGHTEVIDACEWIEDNRFCDAVHLLPLGAQELTDQMNDEIQRILRSLEPPAG